MPLPENLLGPEPVVLAALPPNVAEAALPELEAVGAAVDERKYELTHDAWHWAYASVSDAVPFPCGHLASHSVVALAWL